MYMYIHTLQLVSSQQMRGFVAAGSCQDAELSVQLTGYFNVYMSIVHVYICSSTHWVEWGLVVLPGNQRSPGSELGLQSTARVPTEPWS